MIFSDDELDRYARHLVLPEVGGAGQQKLKQAQIAIIGAGGLGAPALLYLAAAGVGKIGLFDGDIVERSNLQRQIIYSESQIGRKKTDAVQEKILALNRHVALETHDFHITEENAAKALAPYDFILDGTDRYASRLLIARIAEDLRKPLITSGVTRFEGFVTLLKPYLTNAEGKPYPRYEMIFPNDPGAQEVCSEIGIVGALTGLIGSIMAMEAIKEITGAGETLLGRLLHIDALRWRLQCINLL